MLSSINGLTVSIMYLLLLLCPLFLLLMSVL